MNRTFNPVVFIILIICLFVCKLVLNELMFNLFFIVYNLFVAGMLILGINVFFQSVILYPEKKFVKYIFIYSLLIRLLGYFSYQFLWLEFTNSYFSPSAKDELGFHRVAIIFSEMIAKGEFNFLDSTKLDFDDIGYPIILGFIYNFFGESVIIARLFSVLISSLSVLLMFSVTSLLINKEIAKISSIIMLFTGIFYYYVSLHLKETYIIFFILLGINAALKLQRQKYLNSVLLILLSLIGLLLMRYVLFVIMILSVGVYFFYKYYSQKRKIKILLFGFIVLLGLYFVLNFLGIYSLYEERTASIFQFNEGSINVVGGRGVQSFEKQKVSVGTLSALPILIFTSPITPLPSITQTNLYNGQAEQWYHVGGLLIWGLLTYYFYLGIYYLFKHKKIMNSLILFSFLFFYTSSLILSFYITSVRFNVPKMLLMIPYISYGIFYCSKKQFSYWYIYGIGYLIIFIIWNYIKISSRGF